MDNWYTLEGFEHAIATAADLIGPDVPDDCEYKRGQVELIRDLYIRGGDPGDDTQRHYIERRIHEQRTNR